MAACSISIARESDFAAVAELWREFKLLRGDDCHPVGAVNLSEEIAALPGEYAYPENFVLLAKAEDETPVGSLSLKRFKESIGEARRMYVRPVARGYGLGSQLMQECITRAKNLGYKKIYLDSLKKFTHAHHIYEQLGFSYIAPYDPATTQAMKEQMIFMEKAL